MLDPDQFLVGISKSFLWDLCLLCLKNFGRLTPGLGPFAEEHAQSIAEKLHQEHPKVVQQRIEKERQMKHARADVWEVDVQQSATAFSNCMLPCDLKKLSSSTCLQQMLLPGG